MAKESVSERPEVSTADLMAALVQSNQMLAENLRALKDNQKPEDITFDDPRYQAELAKLPKFPRPVTQNGRQADPSGLTPEQLRKVGELKAGSYEFNKTKIEVRVGNANGIDLVYSSKTLPQRMANERDLCDHQGLGGMIDKLYAAQNPAS